MTGFYYFFEQPIVLADDGHKDKVDSQRLLSYGLHSLSDINRVPSDAVLSSCVGPSGKTGHVLLPKPLWSENPKTWTYRSAQQTWVDRGLFWIGWDNENVPTEEDLRKEKVYGAYDIMDASKRSWSVPIIDSPDDRTTLPSNYSFDADGKLILRMKREFREYWEMTLEIAEYLFCQGELTRLELDERWPAEWCATHAARMLSINYRVGLHEIAAFDEMGIPLLDEGFVLSLFRVVTDWEKVVAMEDFQKKRDAVLQKFKPSSSKPSPGETDCTPVTGQPLVT